MDVIRTIAAIVIALAAIVIIIFRILKIKVSHFLILAILDILMGLFLLGFAIYDFNTSVGEFAGILGQIALIIGEPVVVGILIVDVIAWILYKRNQERKGKSISHLEKK